MGLHYSNVSTDVRQRPDEAWKGWWGANPPYHVPVFVLTHHSRASLAMQLGYECTEHVATPKATHVVLSKRTASRA
jgi:hypothetical protein